MKLCIIIPVFNEEGFIEKSIKSIINQTVQPDRVIYVNDSSTDSTKELINDFSSDFDWIDIIDKESKEQHIPGRKVIEAFNFGLKNLKINYLWLFYFKIYQADLIFILHKAGTLTRIKNNTIIYTF